MLTIMDLLKKSSAGKLEKMIEEQGQPVAFVVANLLEAQLETYGDNTQRVPKVVETKHSAHPKNTNTNDAEYSEDGIYAAWRDYPKRAAKAFTANEIRTPKDLVNSYDFKMMSELHGVGASTAQKVFEKLREDGFVKTQKDMGKIVGAVAATAAPAKNTKPESVTKRAAPKVEAEDDEDAVATDWYGKILNLSPNGGSQTLASARDFFARAWNISSDEAMDEFRTLGVVNSFKADSSPKNITQLIKLIVNNLPAQSNVINDIKSMSSQINTFGGKSDIDEILSDFDKSSLNLLTVSESVKIYNELEYDLQSYKDAAAHQSAFATDEDDEFEDEDDEDDMPF